MATLKQGSPVHCPACKQAQEDVVEDYVVPGRIGPRSESEHECEFCDANFVVTCVAPNAYEICLADD